MAWIDNALKGTTKGAANAAKVNEKFGVNFDWIEDSQRGIDFIRIDGSKLPSANNGNDSLWQKVLDRLTVKDSNQRSWLNKGLLEDGAQDGDIWKTILASFSDAGEDLLAGGLNIGESLLDTSAMLLPAMLEGQQARNSKLGIAPTA